MNIYKEDIKNFDDDKILNLLEISEGEDKKILEREIIRRYRSTDKIEKFKLRLLKAIRKEFGSVYEITRQKLVELISETK